MQTTIFKANLAKVVEKLEKLNRKAIKLGLTPLEYKIEDTTPVTLHIDLPYPCFAPCLPGNGLGHHRVYQQVIVTLTGEAPTINGWSLLARLEHFGEANLVHVVPGVETNLDKFRSRQVCDHCNVNNNRKETYLITDGNQIKQIGRNCLADYLRSADHAQNIVAMGAYLRSLSSALEPGEDDKPQYLTPEYPTVEVVGLAVACIRQFGYVKRNNEDEKYPTAMRIQDHYFSSKRDDKIEVNDDDKMAAAAAIAWVSNQPETSDYIRNLKILASQESVLDRHWGYLASLPVAYARSLETTTPGANSEHAGNEGDKVSIEVEIVDIRAIETEYGVSHLVKMVDARGNVLTWFASNLPRCERVVNAKIVAPIEPGAKVTIKGTIKRHTEYKGQKQTQLTRCKFD